ncbi:MAG: glycosyltransferase family 1 protein [Bacteroidetes bacterium]|nr:glycosyltransferase family 1 protein [Bacteroidota bacterium]
MKVLFLGSQDVDYLQDVTFAGLRKVLGIGNICVMPWNRKYFLPLKEYPRNMGYAPGAVLPSLHSRFFLTQFDAVIVGSAKPDCFRLYHALAPSFHAGMKTVFVDGGDREEVGGDLDRMHAYGIYTQAVEARPFNIVLKREMVLTRTYEKNVYPFPFAWNFDRLPRTLPSEKLYDVSFWAVESDPVRTRVLELLQDKFDCRQNGTVVKQVFKKYKRKGEFYLQELAACRIVLNFRGVGWDTLRYWEVPALSTFMISQRPGIIIPDNFEHGRSIVFVDQPGELEELCAYYLRHKEERERIARKSAEHIRAHHTDVHRARQLLSMI